MAGFSNVISMINVVLANKFQIRRLLNNAPDVNHAEGRAALVVNKIRSLYEFYLIYVPPQYFSLYIQIVLKLVSSSQPR